MADELDLRPPPEFTSVLKWLAGLDEESFQQGLNGLSGVPYERKEVLAILARSWGDRAKRVIEILESLSDVQRLVGASAQVVANSVQLTVDSDASKEILTRRIQQLLSSPTVTFISRGRDLAGEREHILDDARILTDIRPMFTPGRTDELDGAIVTHSLRLRYSGAAEPTLHIALDKAHLHLLHEQIERALGKATHLEQVLSQLKIPYVEPGGDFDESLEPGTLPPGGNAPQ